MVFVFVAVLYVLYKAVKFLFSYLFTRENLNQPAYEDEWFGKGNRPDYDLLDTSIRPFKINVPDEVLTDLKNRLQRARFEPPLQDSNFEYGFNSNYLQSIIEYWKTEFDWKKQEEQLNKYPHFKASIDGVDVHFVHVKPTIPAGKKLKVIPILITHGWPGSFYEFYKIIPLLTVPRENQEFVFEVVCPSIPGYGFSESPYKKGFNVRGAAAIFVTLMARLGYNRFYLQGGDWGSLVSQCLAKYYPNRVRGLHLNMYSARPKAWGFLKALVIAYFPSLVSVKEYNLFYPFKKKVMYLLQETGYFHIQATKPDTAGSAIADSPVGLAAYILEKFSTWTDKENCSAPDGNLTRKYTLDELLTNIMIYWVNNNFTASARFYKENMMGDREHESMPLTVPTGFAAFPNELFSMPRCLMTGSVQQLVTYSIMPRGGHFAAFEEPELLADDIWKFVDIVQKTEY